MAEVAWAVTQEMELTVDDVLARRVRLLFIDAREAVAAAPKVAALMAHMMGKDKAWEEQQVAAFKQIAANYV